MTNNIYQALSNAQGEFGQIVKDKTARVKTKSGYEYSYKYCDLGTLLRIITPVLHKHGLVIYQLPYRDENKVGVVTVLKHIQTGEELSSEFYLTTDDPTPQTIGSLVTYARRYAIQSMLGVVAEEDDDAIMAQGLQVVEGATQEQLQEIERLISELEALQNDKTIRQRWMTFMRIKALNELTKEQAQKGIEVLKTKLEVARGKKS